MTAVLRADGLGKRYGATWALRDCSLELPEGRVAALIGPNGAGKTMLDEPLASLDPVARRECTAALCLVLAIAILAVASRLVLRRLP